MTPLGWLCAFLIVVAVFAHPVEVRIALAPAATTQPRR